MTTRKRNNTIWCFIGTLIISVCLMVFITQVGAETMKFKVSKVATQVDVYPVGDVEGHNINFLMGNGTIVSENGEVGSYKALNIADATVGKGGSLLGYFILTFIDGSTIVGTHQQGTFSQDPEGKVSWIQKGSGELISGTRCFEGIKGTVAFTGKILKPAKGEDSGKAYNDFTLTYTLP